MRRYVLPAVVVLVAVVVACGGDDGGGTTEVLREHGACRMAVRVMAEADPDAGEDDVRQTLADETSSNEELVDLCIAIADDLCSGTNREPLPECPGEGDDDDGGATLSDPMGVGLT